MTEGTAILLGNGPNRLSESSVSWRDVLDSLLAHTPFLRGGADSKPLPLLFEEIALAYARNEMGNEGDLKRLVASKVELITPNSIHHMLSRVGVAEILTTNYDYTLEEVLQDQGDMVYASATNEKKNSLFRVRVAEGGRRIWHIHGEVGCPRSIALGFGHYVSNLCALHKYTHGDGLSKPVSPFIRRSRESQGQGVQHSWIDVFLRCHVFVVGLGMGFEETDLWWAIALKERLRMAYGRRLGHTLCYRFSSDGKVDAVGSTLLALGVRVVLVELEGAWDYHRAYIRIIQDLRVRSRRVTKRFGEHSGDRRAEWLGR